MKKPKHPHALDSEETSEATIRRLIEERKTCADQLNITHADYMRTQTRLREVEAQLIWHRQMNERLAAALENLARP